MKKNYIIKSLLITLLLGGIIYYVTYPSLNITNIEFWTFVFALGIIYTVIYTMCKLKIGIDDLIHRRKIKKNYKEYKAIIIFPLVFVIIIIINLILSPIFNSKAYYGRIKVDTTGDFSTDVDEVDFNKVPLLDRDSSLKIGDRTMGQMSELVSQFDVSNQYTQINYNNEIMRVTPLEYNGVIKWLINRKNGIKGYITVNSTTGEAKLIKLKKGLRYAPSALFNENLYRKIQFSYPTKNIESVNFEIDNDGNPYWIASVVKYVDVGLRREVTGVIIFNPINGKSKYYKVKDVPAWVDHVYEADLILEQVADWGKYKNGFFNSFIGQKGVVATTEGYNYLAQNDDIYLYTGITSVISDESNIGFILTNMRTKETKYYSVAGAEEYSAMDSAKGQVQQMNYTSTFPLLINLNNRPTYLVSLKDNAGLVKMYGFVDVVDYQKVSVTDSSKGIKKAAEVYLNEVDIEDTEKIQLQKTITIADINMAEIDGNTYYYFTDEEENRYKASIKVDKNSLPFIKIGDTIEIEYTSESDVTNITKIYK